MARKAKEGTRSIGRDEAQEIELHDRTELGWLKK